LETPPLALRTPQRNDLLLKSVSPYHFNVARMELRVNLRRGKKRRATHRNVPPSTAPQATGHGHFPARDRTAVHRDDGSAETTTVPVAATVLVAAAAARPATGPGAHAPPQGSAARITTSP